MSAPLCKDCALCRPPLKQGGIDYEYAMCAVPSPPEPVQGKRQYKYCSIRREYDSDCGERGLQFTPIVDPPAKVIVVRRRWWKW